MGGSLWSYRVPFDRDVLAAFRALQERELAGDSFYWPEEEDDDLGEEFRTAVPPRPASLEELARIKDDDRYEFWAWGTHSILDMDRLQPTHLEDHDGTVRPLSPREVQVLIGSKRPTAEEFEAAHAGPGRLGVGLLWSGRYTVLYRDGHPDELAFWGISGD
jgi:hypothetical protein